MFRFFFITNVLEKGWQINGFERTGSWGSSGVKTRMVAEGCLLTGPGSLALGGWFFFFGKSKEPRTGRGVMDGK